MGNLRTATTETPEIVETPRLGKVAQFPRVIGTFMGRDALSLAISYLDLSTNDTVLLPVYTCQDVLSLFVGKCYVVFYDVGPDLTIRPDEVRAKLRGRSVIKMMLITNYFGFLQPYRNEIKELCADRDIFLIEDCAHSLLTQGSGETGDLSIYSFRKILPLPDGGGLGVNSNAKLPVPKYYPRCYSDTLSILAIVKSLLKIRTEKLSRARITSHTARVLPLPKKGIRILPLSYFARHNMANMPFNEITRKRRDDFQFWREVTSRNGSLVPVFGSLPPGVCPLGFVVRTKDRDSLEARARDNGIQLRVHWRLDATLGSECSTSHELSKQMLTLPVYPELGQKKREVLAGIVAR